MNNGEIFETDILCPACESEVMYMVLCDTDGGVFNWHIDIECACGRAARDPDVVAAVRAVDKMRACGRIRSEQNARLDAALGTGLHAALGCALAGNTEACEENLGQMAGHDLE